MYKEEIQDHNIKNTKGFFIYKDEQKKILIKREYYRLDSNILYREDIIDENPSYKHYVIGYDSRKLEITIVDESKRILYYASGKIQSIFDFKSDLSIQYYENGQN